MCVKQHLPQAQIFLPCPLALEDLSLSAVDQTEATYKQLVTNCKGTLASTFVYLSI